MAPANSLDPRLSPACRSLLYVPVDKPRAHAKAMMLPADALILDLEDGLAAASKTAGRACVPELLLKWNELNTQHLKLLRINSLGSDWGREDLLCLRQWLAPGGELSKVLHGIVVPKVEGEEHLEPLANLGLPLWAMIETPRGVARVEQICKTLGLLGLIMGAEDLAAALGLRPSSGREGLLYAFSRCINAARAHNLAVYDGVHVNISDLAGLRKVCEEDACLGFDGKSIIHPSHLAVVNEVFAPSAAEIARARAILKVWTEAQQLGKGLAMLDGEMIESLHAERARRMLARGELFLNRKPDRQRS